MAPAKKIAAGPLNLHFVFKTKPTDETLVTTDKPFSAKKNSSIILNMKTNVLILLLFSSFFCVSCSNLFKLAANKTSDKALFYEAEKLIDEQKYTEAITYLDQLSTTFAADNKVRIIYATAYAGACGMEFITFFGSIKGGVSGAFFKTFMNLFTNRSATPNYCVLAERKIKEIGATATTRDTATEEKESNFFMAILSMAKIGAYLRTKADTDNDGLKDASFDICTNDATTGFTSAEVDEIVTGFGLFIENLPYLLGAGSTASISGPITTLCPTCLITDTSSIPDEPTRLIIRSLYRDLLNSSTTGIGSCTDNPAITCCATTVD
jgi:hypothetical protein